MKKTLIIFMAALALSLYGGLALAQSIGIGKDGVTVKKSTGESVKADKSGVKVKTSDQSDSSLKVDKSGAKLEAEKKQSAKGEKNDDADAVIEGKDGAKVKAKKDGSATLETPGGSKVKADKSGNIGLQLP